MTTTQQLPEVGTYIRVTTGKPVTLRVVGAYHSDVSPGSIVVDGIKMTKAGQRYKRAHYKIVKLEAGDWQSCNIFGEVGQTSVTDTGITAEPVVKLVQVQADNLYHAVGDRKTTPRKYAVQLDGVTIGHVFTTSQDSYRSDGTGSRLRWGHRGYSRSWRGELKAQPGRQVSWGSGRKRAVEDLIAAYRSRGAA